MQCPTCNVELIMSDRHGVEIDYCPKCRGVWLDRGELDKIIERASENSSHSTRNRDDDDDDNRYDERRHDSHDDHDDRHDRHSNSYHNNGQHKKHKKESFLGDLFDF